jgi:hypothetical protein
MGQDSGAVEVEEVKMRLWRGRRGGGRRDTQQSRGDDDWLMQLTDGPSAWPARRHAEQTTLGCSGTTASRSMSTAATHSK